MKYELCPQSGTGVVFADPFDSEWTTHTRVTYKHPILGEQVQDIIPTDFLLVFFAPSVHHPEQWKEYEDNKREWLKGDDG